MEALILILVFAGVLLLMVGTYAVVNRQKLSAQRESRSRLLGGPEQPVSIFREEQASGFSFLNRMLSGRSFTESLANELRRAGSSRKPGEAVLILGVCIALGFVVGQAFGGALWAVVLAAIGGGLPLLQLRRAQAKRERKLEEQLPDALDMLVNSLRAGYSLQAAMEFVGREMAEPLGPEFARFYDEQRLGMDIRSALLRFEERVGTSDIKMFVTSLLIQRETGGNLGEVLGNLAILIRDRVAFRGHVRTLTAEPTFSAYVLSALPFAVFLLFALMNREYESLLWTTAQGRTLALYGVCSIAVGYLLLRRMARIEI